MKKFNFKIWTFNEIDYIQIRLFQQQLRLKLLSKI